MAVTAKLNYLRIAPRKVRLVVDLIRGKTVGEAQTILNFTTKRANKPLLKLLKSAAANAKHNFQIDESNLYISKIVVDEGKRVKKIKKIKKVKKPERKEKIERIPKPEKPVKESKLPTGRAKIRPEMPTPKPKIERGIKRIFRRKAF